MAGIASNFTGVLIGYDNYTKEGKTTHTYYVLVAQKQDKETGLYGACELVSIRAAAPLAGAKHGQKVSFLGELRRGKNNTQFMAYSDIELLK